MYFAMSITFHNIEVWFTETTTVDSEIKRSLKSGGIWEIMAKMLVYGTKIQFLGRGVVACGKSRPNILLSIVMERFSTDS